MTAPNLVDAIVADHREVEMLFGEIEASGDVRNRGELVERVIVDLVRHSVAEEQHLYPVVRGVLANGDEIADHELAEHAEAERVMKRLARTDPTDSAFEELVTSLIRDVRHHIEEEERDLLPRLRVACDDADLRELGLKFEQSKKIAPTRPHPAAPDRPPANKIVGPGMGLIDRVRDAMTGRAR